MANSLKEICPVLTVNDASPTGTIYLLAYKPKDEYGHDVGDRLLSAFGALLLADGRKSDVVCRHGGEEFCLLMPGTTAAAAQHKLAQWLARWRQQVFELQGRQLQGLSFTAGVCDSLLPCASGEALLKAADQALLAAKRNGRAQVRLAQGVIDAQDAD